jgi:signal transduction histidine kinase/ActR/RegA family two-component response regulator/exosome complex RNA-binding protein Rrp4
MHEVAESRAGLSGSPGLKPGDRVIGEVYKVRWDRILLRLPRGFHGIVRQREMSWEEAEPDPDKLARVGGALEAVVVQVDAETKSAELSLRFAQYDPWDGLVTRLKKDQVVEGMVTHVRQVGAFVEIEPGVTAFLPPPEILPPEETGQPALEALWPGDRVRALVKEIDPQRRQVWLSIRDYLAVTRGRKARLPEAEAGRAHLSDVMDLATTRHFRQKLGDLPPEVEWPEPNRIRTILVADDNEEFNHSVTELLRDVGYGVESARDAETALQILREHPCDLILLDLSLSPLQPLRLAQEIVVPQQQTQLLLLSGFEVEDSIITDIQAAGLMLEHKPLGPQGLAYILRRLEAGDSLRVHSSQPSVAAQKSSARPIVPTHQEITRLLHRLLKPGVADGAVLFEPDEDRPGHVIWRFQAGVEVVDTSDVRSTLLYSPVGEVLRGRRSVSISNSERAQGRSHYLLRAVSFKSCIGVPVQTAAREAPLALFLFSSQPNAFPKSLRESLTLTARELANLLFRQAEVERFLITQGELLQSQLRAGALHDVRHTLGSLGLTLNLLERHVSQPALTSDDRETIHTLALELRGIVDQMTRTADLSRDLGRSERSEAVDVNLLIRRIVDRQKLLASHWVVQLTFVPEGRLPALIINPSQLQQVLDNLILNALQWSAGRPKREVKVTARLAEPQEGQRSIEIRVEDSGPGIHRRLQGTKIFELGFSTRAGGSGLGLFVVRALLDSLKGRVTVEQSVMEVGTTFLVELPIMDAE